MNKHERVFREYISRTDSVMFENKIWRELSCSKVDVGLAFIKYGWSFVHSLWEALLHADWFNSEKLINTRKEYTEEYFNTFILPKEEWHS